MDVKKTSTLLNHSLLKTFIQKYRTIALGDLQGHDPVAPAPDWSEDLESGCNLLKRTISCDIISKFWNKKIRIKCQFMAFCYYHL